MGDEIPQWAKERARALCNAERAGLPNWGECRSLDPVINPDLHALARYIAAHEEPPVDPLYEALFAVVELGRYDTREQTELLRGELERRGLKIVPADA